MTIELRIKLAEVLERKGWTRVDLHEKSGVRRAYISEIANNNRTTLNRENLGKIIKTLGITDMNEIFEVVEMTSQAATRPPATEDEE